jgi:hypothetical protein
MKYRSLKINCSFEFQFKMKKNRTEGFYKVKLQH